MVPFPGQMETPGKRDGTAPGRRNGETKPTERNACELPRISDSTATGNRCPEVARKNGKVYYVLWLRNEPLSTQFAPKGSSRSARDGNEPGVVYRWARFKVNNDLPSTAIPIRHRFSRRGRIWQI